MVPASAASSAARSNTAAHSAEMRHRDIGGLGRVGQRAHADEVHAGLGIGADVFEHDAAGGLGGNPARLLLSRVQDLRSPGATSWMRSTDRRTSPGVMLSSRMASAPNSSASSSSCAAAHLHLHALALLAPLQGPRQHGGQPAAQRDVVVLDEDAAGQVDAVIGPPAAQHGVLFQQPQAGHGLARIEHMGAACREWRPHTVESAWRCRSGAASG